jgi:nucleoside-diphosphate-sugar epimerase
MGKVLVTGGAGYGGSVLVRRLLETGKDVSILEKFYFGRESIEEIAGHIEIINGDVRSFDLDHLNEVEAIIHLAGLSNDPMAEYNPKANWNINLLGTQRLAQACKEYGIERFIFASSCSIYHSYEPNDGMRDENSVVRPTAPYSLSKYKAEQTLLDLADNSFCPVILRKGTIYGSSPRMRYDLVVNTFAKDAFLKRRLIVHSGGRVWRPLLHVEDAADAYVACLLAPKELIRGQIFNVLTANYRVLDLAHEVRRTIEQKKGVRLDLDIQEVGVARSYRVCSEKLSKTLGFHPKGKVSEAVCAMWDELENSKDPTHPIHYNIRWIELLHEMESRLRVIGSVF